MESLTADSPVDRTARLGCGGILGALAAWSYLTYWQGTSAVAAVLIVAFVAVLALLTGDFFWRNAVRILRLIGWLS